MDDARATLTAPPPPATNGTHPSVNGNGTGRRPAALDVAWPFEPMGPRLRARTDGLIRTVGVLALAMSAVYLTYRWGWTLNRDALWFSVPLALAETYGFVTLLFLLITSWGPRRRVPPAAPRGLAVDVFVTTFDEPLRVIRKTA